MELQVTKYKSDEILYKTNHLDTSCKTLSLKKLTKSAQEHSVQTLNTGMNNVSKEKNSDLVSLCSGSTTVIKLREHKSFYIFMNRDKFLFIRGPASSFQFKVLIH